MRYCKENKIKPHPARFPGRLPEFFIRMLTDRGDVVFDPFAGSCVTGEVSEHLGRNWICCEVEEEYLQGALGRFQSINEYSSGSDSDFYTIQTSWALWDQELADVTPLSEDGGKKRK
jgi:site-specific DNA-methyltransferase (cytosine-N4-specific)